MSSITNLPYTISDGTTLLSSPYRAGLLYITPDDHGYKVSNTTTENTVAVQAAINACVTSGKVMMWPPRDHEINANLNDFHSVGHLGNGTITRNGSTWHIKPEGDQENVIHVSTTGTSTNDGITSDSPILTGQEAVGILKNYITQGCLPGRWIIDIAAGQYDRIRFPDECLLSENNIIIRGEERAVSTGNVWFSFFEGTTTGLMTVGGTITGTTSGAVATITDIFSAKDRAIRADIVSGTPQINETFTDSISGNSGQVEYLSPTPTTIIREGSNQAAFGILGSGINLNVSDLLIEDYNGSLSSCGLSVIRGSEIYGNNIHVYNCYWGVSGSNKCTINLKGGVLYNNGFENSTTAGGAGIRGLFFPKFEVGTQNAGNRSAGPLIFSNSIGARAQEGAKGHLDWSLVYGNINGGVRLLVSSRINGSGTQLSGNGGSGVYVTRGSHFDDDGNCEYIDNGRNTSVGMAGTAANFITGYTAANAANPAVLDTFHYLNGFVFNSTSAQDLSTLTIAQEALEDAQFTGIAAKRITYRVQGVLSGTTGSYKRFVMRVGTIPTVLSFGSSVVGDFDIELFVEFIGVDSQFVSISGKCVTTTTCRSTFISAPTSSDIPVDVELLVQDSADSITVNRYEITQIGF